MAVVAVPAPDASLAGGSGAIRRRLSPRPPAETPALAGCKLFPADNIWNARVDTCLPSPPRYGQSSSR